MLLSLSSSKAFLSFKPIFSLSSALPHKLSLISSASRSSSINTNDSKALITLQEWQRWGSASPLPAKVKEIIDEFKSLELNSDTQMDFGGNHGRFRGEFRVVEDRTHREKYLLLDDSEMKFRYYTARQIACRVMGSRGYLCQKCWLAMEDCMCTRITSGYLWNKMRFWVYMHPKDFLRQNNTGKLLWQLFGVHSATMCLYGVAEHEEIMWNAFEHAGKDRVWCLYPSQKEVTRSVKEAFSHDYLKDCGSTGKINDDEILNFILIDGTWNNSAAMVRRLKEQSKLVWGEDLCCLSLVTGASTMHKLRPQPSWDRTCTAAAASGLLSELNLLPQFSSYGLDKQAEALEDALVILLETLTTRRIRTGRSIVRNVRHVSSIC